VLPSDPGYDTARRVWNGMVDRRPAAIARCAGVADVINAVTFARRLDVPISVLGGGHNIGGSGIRDGALTIDLRAMKGVRVDPRARSVRAHGGVVLGEFDRETTAFDLTTTMGIASTTGIAGLTLGGGLGYLMGKHGLASDNLLSVDVVLADGSFVTASNEEHADLFWALQGGGGNFGIATSLEYRLHPAEPITGGVVVYPVSRAKDFFHFYRDFTSSTPDTLTVYAGVGIGPPGTPVEGQQVAVAIVCHSGARAEGERLVQPMRAFGPPLLDAIGAIPYCTLQSMLDAAFTPGNRGYWRSYFIPELSDGVIDAIVECTAEGVPGIPGSAVFLEHMHGAVRRRGQHESAFANRAAAYSFGIFTAWADAKQDEQNIRWTRSFGDRIRPLSTGGGYVNYMTEDEGEERVRATYAGSYERLIAARPRTIRRTSSA
jgi:FAD binding domain